MDGDDEVRPPDDLYAVQPDALRLATLAKAAARWRAGGDVAWLVAALSLDDSTDAVAAALAAYAARVPIAAPAGASARYHLVRLTLARDSAAVERARLDPMLARSDLSVTTRNLFLAERAAVAKDMPAFAQLALRCEVRARRKGLPARKLERRYLQDRAVGRYRQPGHDLPRHRCRGRSIDRMPVALRIRLADDAAFAPPLRPDIALTPGARVVELQDVAAIDGLSRRLERLLPQLAPEFAATPPGADKCFLIWSGAPGQRRIVPIFIRLTGECYASVLPCKGRCPMRRDGWTASARLRIRADIQA